MLPESEYLFNASREFEIRDLQASDFRNIVTREPPSPLVGSPGMMIAAAHMPRLSCGGERWIVLSGSFRMWPLLSSWP